MRPSDDISTACCVVDVTLPPSARAVSVDTSNTAAQASAPATASFGEELFLRRRVTTCKAGVEKMAEAVQKPKTLGQKIAGEFERLRAEGMSTKEIYGELYNDLRLLARKKVGAARLGMSATSVVHRLWFRILGKEAFKWETGQYFVCSMARAMQNLLVDEARKRRPETLPPGPPGKGDNLDGKIAISQALQRLEEEDPRQAEIVRLIVVAGLTEEETAETLDFSLPTIKKEYRKAKAWLKDFLESKPQL
jgi:RNA polymerase sigma factor (TIGR02999 family)